jgi:hypothetical protein
MQEMSRRSGMDLVVQRYDLPSGADAVAYVNTLIQLRCSTIVTVGTSARSAVASRRAAESVPRVRFVVVADQPLPGTTHLAPDAVNARALSRTVTR